MNYFEMKLGPRLTKVERERAVCMLAGWTLTIVVIRLNVAVSTIHRLKRRVNDTGVTDDRPYPGATRVTAQAEDL